MRPRGLVLLASVVALLALALPETAEAGRRRPGSGGTPDIDVTTDASGNIPFGEVVVTATGTAQVEIRNTGNAQLTLFVAGIATDSSYFAPQLPAQNITIFAGQSDFIDIDFSPPADGDFNATLTIESNDPNENPLSVPLTGTGVTPDIRFAPTTLAFGAVVEGETSTKAFQISNIGTGTLVVSNITAEIPEFVPLQTTASIGAGASVSIDVAFTPSTNRLFSDALIVENNDPDHDDVGEAPAYVLVVGRGNAAPENVSVSADSTSARVDEPIAFSASATDRDGDPLSFSWSFGDGNTGSGSSTSHAYSAGGSYDVTVTADDGRGGSTTSAPFTVTIADRVALFLTPTSLGVGFGGDPGRLRALYLFDDGSRKAATAADGDLPVFQSSAPGVVSVLPDGSLAANAEGAATITASLGLLLDTATVGVGAASSIERVGLTPSDLLTVVVDDTEEVFAFAIDAATATNLDTVSVQEDSGGSILAIDSVTPNGESVQVVLRGVSPGAAELTVRSSDDPGVFQTVEVRVPALQTLTIVPSPVALSVSEVATLVPEATASDGTHSFAFADTPVSWASDVPAIAPVFPNGKLVGLATGSALVTATSAITPSVQGGAGVTVTAASGLPQIVVSGLAGEDVVANGIDAGTVAYGFTSQGGIVSAPDKERVVVLDNQGTAPLEVVYVEASTDRLAVAAPAGALEPERLGAVSVAVTLPSSALGTSTPGPTSGTVTLFTNDPTQHQIALSTSWTWQQLSGDVPDAIVPMFLDFGDVPDGAVRDRTIAFQLFEQGSNSGVVQSVTVSGSGFSLRNPNPNPFMADAFPVEQASEDVPLTFTLRAAPASPSGRFQGTLTFASDDADEPLIEALVVAYGAPALASVLPSDLALATFSNSQLLGVDGSERVLVPVPSGSAGLEYDAASGVARMYSTLSSIADPAAGNSADAYLFKVPPVGKPQIVSASLSQDATAFTVDFARDLSYVIVPDTLDFDVLSITDAGNVSVAFSGDFLNGAKLATDSAGNIYVSRAKQCSGVGRGIVKYSPSGTCLATLPGTSAVIDFEIANDIVYTDSGQKLDTAGNPVGTFVVVPNSRWFTVDGVGNVLFGANVSSSSQPQPLTLEAPDGTLQDAGELPRRAERVDF
ncbi:MAG: choice-of-anchor D domain-containing protein [Deltaproteobacteria bacterium]|nr:MAG: choice-of-anchor D domain-containing protein [Deltaproteobacteria bacterium]